MKEELWYLSGPMTGLPDNNKTAFMEAAKKFRDHGLYVINPAELHPPGSEWFCAMRKDLRFLSDCYGIILLDGWEKSNGARGELLEALVLKLKVIDGSTMKELDIRANVAFSVDYRGEYSLGQTQVSELVLVSG